MPAKYDPTDRQRYPNPSLGLAIWGPLIPANDCKVCLYTLSGLQIIGGLYLFWKPGRKPGRNVWLNRGMRLGGIVGGSYLMLFAGVELARAQLRSDAWVEDAKMARRKAIEAGKQPSLWFGPEGYQAISLNEWKKRLEGSIKRAEAVGTQMDIVTNAYEEIRERNREVAREVLNMLHTEALDKLEKEDEEEYLKIEPKSELPDVEQPKVEPSEEPPRSKVLSLTRSILEYFNLVEKPEGNADEPLEWNVLEPWDRLSYETDVIIRFLPHSGLSSEDTETEPSDE